MYIEIDNSLFTNFLLGGVFIKCYFDLCIYQKDNACILAIESMEINNLGMCEYREVVTIDEKALAIAKQKRLDELADIWDSDCNTEEAKS